MQAETFAIRKEIRESRMADFENQFVKLQRKARKLGLPEPRYEIIESHVVSPELTHKDFGETARKWEDARTYVNIINIYDVNVHIEGWKLVGIVDSNTFLHNTIFENGIKINNAIYTTFEILPDECFKKAPKLCEHCNFCRKRNTTFILKNVETKEYKQVGSSCLEDFTQIKNANSIANYVNSWYSTANYEIDEKTHKEDMHVQVEYLLPIAVKIVDEHGFNSLTSKNPSVYEMQKLIDNFTEAEEKYQEKSKDILKYYQEKLPLITNDSTFSNEMIKAVCSYSIIPKNLTLTYLLCAVRDYNIFLKKRIAKSEFFGEIGEKYTFNNVELLKAKSIQSFYGEAISATFDYNGYTLSTITNPTTGIASKLLNSKPGTIFNFEAKIKNHKNINDLYYTNISGIKFL